MVTSEEKGAKEKEGEEEGAMMGKGQEQGGKGMGEEDSEKEKKQR